MHFVGFCAEIHTLAHRCALLHHGLLCTVNLIVWVGPINVVTMVYGWRCERVGRRREGREGKEEREERVRRGGRRG